MPDLVIWVWRPGLARRLPVGQRCRTGRSPARGPVGHSLEREGPTVSRAKLHRLLRQNLRPTVAPIARYGQEDLCRRST